MVDKGMMKFQIGKSGVTAGIVASLQNAFTTHKIIRISVLKSAARDKQQIRAMAEALSEQLKGNYKYRVIGFTIILRRSKTQ